MAIGLTLLSTVAIVLALIPIAYKCGWVDRPGSRKVHEQATPVVGGVGIFLALLLGTVLSPLAMSLHAGGLGWLLLSGLLLLGVGIVDDLRGLSPLLRFLIQITACLVMIGPANVLLSDFGTLFTGEMLELGVIAVPITLFAALGVINAFNMIDGMDGLGGSIFLVSATGMALFAFQGGASTSALMLALAIAAVSGFLLFNAHFPWITRAKVFLGNSGSLLLGFILAWFFISLGNGDDRIFMPMTAVWLFAVPLLDTSTLIWTRWRQGHSAFEADNQHLHHAFLRAGFSVEATWLAITGFAVVMALIGTVIELSTLPEYFSFYLFMLIAFSYYFYLRHCWRSQRFLGRHFVHHDFTIEETFAR